MFSLKFPTTNALFSDLVFVTLYDFSEDQFLGMATLRKNKEHNLLMFIFNCSFLYAHFVNRISCSSTYIVSLYAVK